MGDALEGRQPFQERAPSAQEIASFLETVERFGDNACVALYIDRSMTLMAPYGRGIDVRQWVASQMIKKPAQRLVEVRALSNEVLTPRHNDRLRLARVELADITRTLDKPQSVIKSVTQWYVPPPQA